MATLTRYNGIGMLMCLSMYRKEIYTCQTSINGNSRDELNDELTMPL
jgi:hypothetical protein